MPCGWESKTMPIASSTIIRSNADQTCPCDFPLEGLGGLACALGEVLGPQSKKQSHLMCGTQVGKAKAMLQDSSEASPSVDQFYCLRHSSCLQENKGMPSSVRHHL